MLALVLLLGVGLAAEEEEKEGWGGHSKTQRLDPDLRDLSLP
jgi:hypothetical protein